MQTTLQRYAFNESPSVSVFLYVESIRIT